MIKNSSKPTKSELAILIEHFVREEIKRVHHQWAGYHGKDGHPVRPHAQEQALRRVLDFIVKNKRS
jgi:hypothetical protein